MASLTYWIFFFDKYVLEYLQRTRTNEEDKGIHSEMRTLISPQQ